MQKLSKNLGILIASKPYFRKKIHSYIDLVTTNDAFKTTKYVCVSQDNYLTSHSWAKKHEFH